MATLHSLVHGLKMRNQCCQKAGVASRSCYLLQYMDCNMIFIHAKVSFDVRDVGPIVGISNFTHNVDCWIKLGILSSSLQL